MMLPHFCGKTRYDVSTERTCSKESPTWPPDLVCPAKPGVEQIPMGGTWPAERIDIDEGVKATLSKQAKVHFITAYLEYLYDQGIKSEYYYVGDASRFLRFLIQNSKPGDVEAFLSSSSSPAYRKRLEMTLRKFYAFAAERLDVTNNPLENRRRPAAGPIDNA